MSFGLVPFAQLPYGLEPEPVTSIPWLGAFDIQAQRPTTSAAAIQACGTIAPMPFVSSLGARQPVLHFTREERRVQTDRAIVGPTPISSTLGAWFQQFQPTPQFPTVQVLPPVAPIPFVPTPGAFFQGPQSRSAQAQMGAFMAITQPVPPTPTSANFPQFCISLSAPTLSFSVRP